MQRQGHSLSSQQYFSFEHNNKYTVKHTTLIFEICQWCYCAMVSMFTSSAVDCEFESRMHMSQTKDNKVVFTAPQKTQHL
jgi:hypothetical protein